MAEKKEGKKNKKGKKGIMGIVTIILVPILIVVLLASFFFAIIDGIINLIKGLIGSFLRAIIDLFKNPVQWVESRWSELSRWWNKTFDRDGFNAASYEENGRVDPTMIIESTTFDKMKKELEAVINRNAAGLDDVMLKKMLLTYYRGIYLNDTTVLIELTKEDLQIDEEKWVSLFNITAYKKR